MTIGQMIPAAAVRELRQRNGALSMEDLMNDLQNEITDAMGSAARRRLANSTRYARSNPAYTYNPATDGVLRTI